MMPLADPGHLFREARGSAATSFRTFKENWIYSRWKIVAGGSAATSFRRLVKKYRWRQRRHRSQKNMKIKPHY